MPRDFATASARIDAAEVHNLWPAPDMAVLAAGRRRPPAMPGEVFGSSWGLLSDLANSAGAPVDYVALGFIVAAASLIGGKRRVRPWDTSDWSEPCILWGAVVGDPSAKKSPALDAVTGPLRNIEADHADDHSGALSSWQAETERSKAERANWQEAVKKAAADGVDTPPLPANAEAPDMPERRRALVQDATIEAMAKILSGNPAGTLMLRDELAGWLASFDRYSPGGRTFWIEAYGGRPFVVDRLKNEGKPLRINFTGVSVLGGIQPEKLNEVLLSGADDGLPARFLWAWPERVPFRQPDRPADAHRLETIYRKLDGLGWGVNEKGERVPIVLSFNREAIALYNEWSATFDADVDDAGHLYAGAVGKLCGTVPRLALVLELLAWASGGGAEPHEISGASVGAALHFCESYARPMALRVFGDAALPPVERHAATLGRYIIKHGLARINAGEVRRNWRLPGLKDADAVKTAIDWLVDAEWLRWD